MSLDLSVANINIASDKAKSTIGFIANNVNMFVPTEVTSDIYAQIFDMVHMLKLVANGHVYSTDAELGVSSLLQK